MANGKFGIWKWGVLSQRGSRRIHWPNLRRINRFTADRQDSKRSFRINPTGQRRIAKPFPWTLILISFLSSVILIMLIVAIAEFTNLGFWKSMGLLFLIIPITVLVIMVVIGWMEISSRKAARKYAKRIKSSRFDKKTKSLLLEVRGADAASIKRRRRNLRVSALFIIAASLISGIIIVLLSIAVMFPLGWVIVPVFAIITALIFIVSSSRESC